MIIQLYAVGRDENPKDAMSGFWAEIPAGGRLINCSMAPLQGNMVLSVAALVVPNAPRVKRRFFVATFGEDIQPLIGRRIGPYVGHANMPEGVIMVFEDIEATPENTLAAAEVAGHG